MAKRAASDSATPDAAAPAGILARVRAAYWDFSAAARRVLDEAPGDVIALSFLLIAGLIRFVGLTVGAILVDGRADPALFQARLIDNLLFFPAAVYVLSLVLDVILRGCGGRGSWTTTRLIVAWSLVVAAPWIFGLGVIDGYTRGASAQVEALGPVLGAAALAFVGMTAYIVSAGLAAAHGFKSPAKVLFGLAAGGVALSASWIGVLYLSAALS